MHYRNGREAKNGDPVVQLQTGSAKIVSSGILYDATPGNDYCNGRLAQPKQTDPVACMCDCLHADDVADMLAIQGMDTRPSGK